MSLQLVMLVTLVKMSLTPMMRILLIMLAKFVTAVMMIGTLKMMMYGSYSDNSGYTFETNYGNDNDANDENDGIEASGVGD